jgi:hypothetical protein
VSTGEDTGVGAVGTADREVVVGARYRTRYSSLRYDTRRPTDFYGQIEVVGGSWQWPAISHQMTFKVKRNNKILLNSFSNNILQC